MHQQKRQWLPSSSVEALREARTDLQRRKDELIRHRHGLRQCQKKIYDFHLEQIEKRARNFDSFVSRHQGHYKEMKEQRDAIVEEARKAEQELKDLLSKEEDLDEVDDKKEPTGGSQNKEEENSPEYNDDSTPKEDQSQLPQEASEAEDQEMASPVEDPEKSPQPAAKLDPTGELSEQVQQEDSQAVPANPEVEPTALE